VAWFAARRRTGFANTGGLGVGVDDRSEHAAGESAIAGFQHVGQRVVESETGLESFGEEGESARHQKGFPTVVTGKGEESFGPVGQAQAFVVHTLQGGFLETFQQGHPAAEGRRKVQFAPHGGLGDGRHLGLHSHLVGDLVDALDGDESGVHVHCQHPEVCGSQGLLQYGEIQRMLTAKDCRGIG
jgi:hypothetical protein